MLTNKNLLNSLFNGFVVIFLPNWHHSANYKNFVCLKPTGLLIARKVMNSRNLLLNSFVMPFGFQIFMMYVREFCNHAHTYSDAGTEGWGAIFGGSVNPFPTGGGQIIST